MKVRAQLHGFSEKERDVELSSVGTADDLARALGVQPDVVVVMRDGLPIPGDETLLDGETVRVLRVVTGG